MEKSSRRNVQSSGQWKGMTMLKISALLIALVTLTACETAKGIGRDVEDAGEAVQEAAS
jgi:predicted small secreted protein